MNFWYIKHYGARVGEMILLLKITNLKYHWLFYYYRTIDA